MVRRYISGHRNGNHEDKKPHPVEVQDADSRGDQYDNQRDHVREDSEIAGFLLTLPPQR